MGLRMVVLFAALLLSPAPAAAAHRPKAHPDETPAVPLSQIRVFGNRPAPFALDAKSVMLIAGHSGAVLYAYNEHERMQPASLAKIMTFYLALDAVQKGKVSPDTPVPISEAAWRLSIDKTVPRMLLHVGSQVSL